MTMRKQMVTTIEDILERDERLVLLLGDIGVFGFRGAFEKHPTRVYNIGILEQSTVSMAAGLAKTGLIPVVHTIAPFLVERSLEQIKIDFCYQELGGNIVTVGASYDYAALGCTHHCPGDVGILSNLPGMELVLPGTGEEFDTLFREVYGNGNPTYFRLTERENPVSQPVEFGKATMVREGGEGATVVAVGPTLGPVLEAVKDLDVTVLYYTTLNPFDYETLRTCGSGGRVLLCEPYYRGVLAEKISRAFYPRPLVLDCVGIPHRFLTNYGRAEDHDLLTGLNPGHIRLRLETLIHG